MSDESQAGHFRAVFGLPGRQQFVDCGKEMLLWWIPGFFKIVVQMRLIDRPYGGFNIRISGEQHATRNRINFAASCQ